MNRSKPATLADFEQATGLRAHSSPLDGAGDAWTAIAISKPVVTLSDRVLVLIYDLSDSSSTTQRLVRRLPDLLKGWPRDTPVWHYALSRSQALETIPADSVDQILNDPTSLEQIFQNAHLVATQRLEGSFLEPPISSASTRAQKQDITKLTFILLGDGRITDFDPVALPPQSEFLSLVQHRLDAAKLAPLWERAVTGKDVSLLGFDDDRLKVWFDRRRGTRSCNRLRVLSDEPSAVYLLGPDRAMREIGGEELILPSTQRNSSLLVRSCALNKMAIEYSTADGIWCVSGQALLSAPPLASGAKAAFAGALKSVQERPLPILFTSEDAPPTVIEACNLIAESIGSLGTSASRVPSSLSDFIGRQHSGSSGVLIFVKSPKSQTEPVQPHLIAIGLGADADAVSWRRGAQSTFGTVAETWELAFDPLENRWALTIRDASDTVTFPTRLLPYQPLQELPVLATSEGTRWRSIFYQRHA